jgi:hypothetical protein
MENPKNHSQLLARCGKTAFGMLPVQGTPHLDTIDMTRIRLSKPEHERTSQ